METCKTCHWWGQSIVGVCERVDTIQTAQPERLFEIEAFSDDDSGLTARLCTGPDFGCVWHEPKSSIRPLQFQPIQFEK